MWTQLISHVDQVLHAYIMLQVTKHIKAYCASVMLSLVSTAHEDAKSADLALCPRTVEVGDDSDTKERFHMRADSNLQGMFWNM